MTGEPRSARESDEERAETLFAEWLRARERGGSRDFAALAEAHPGERAALLRLHEAWRLVSRALGEGADASAARGASAALAGDPSLFAARYRRERLLGRGGQGEVWLAEDVRLGRRVALKLLAHPDADRMRRFAREAAVASKLEHPSICAVYESGEADGIAFIAMRYVEGASLAQWIEREREHWAERRAARSRSPSQSSAPSEPSEVERVVRIAARASRALQAAHEAGVLHRDVKPGNILVTRDEEPVLVDFGFAADTAGDWSALTRTAQFLGTPAYMSPEQIRGKGAVALDARTDVWSLGATLYECLTGRRPFEGPTWQAIFRSILEEEPASARSLNPILPADVDVILATALAKERERRYPSAAALAADLEAWLDGRPIAARKIGWGGRIARWARREPAIASLVALLALALPLLGALVAYAALTREAVLAAEDGARFRAMEDALLDGFLALEHAEPAEAAAAFDRALALGGGPEAIGGRVQALVQMGRRDDALAAAATLGDGAPERALIEARLRAHVGAGAPASSIAALDRPSTSASESFLLGWAAMPIERAAYVGGGAELVGGDLALAARHLRAAILLSPAPRLLYFLEYVHALGHTSGAGSELAMLADVVRAHWPGSARARVVLAMALAPHDRARALELAREGAALDGGFARAHEVLGAMLAQADDLDGALAAYDRALALEPDDARTHYNRALALRKRGDLAGAVAAYRASLALDPTAAPAWTNLGVALSRLGDLAGAVEAQLTALEHDPDDAITWLNLARDLQMQGELESALDAVRRGHELAAASARADLPSAEWLADVESLLEDRASFDAWIAGASEPPLEERVRLAERAYASGRSEASAEALARLMAEHPELAEESVGGPRTTAAYAAAWLARTREGDAASAWRARATEWLWSELDGLERLLAEDAGVASGVATVLGRWRENPGTRVLLDEELPPGIPAAERERVAELAARVRALEAELARD